MHEQTLLDALAALPVAVGKGTPQEILSIINNHFSDTDLLRLAQELNKVGAWANIKWKVNWVISDSPHNDIPVLRLLYKGTTKFGPVTLVRSISKEGNCLVAYHNKLIIPEALQKKHLSRDINGILFRYYPSLTVHKIYIKADLQAGGYVWARAGFSATIKGEVETILERAYKLHNEQGSTITTAYLIYMQEIFDEHYNKTPTKPFFIHHWTLNRNISREILVKTRWNGILDFANQDQISIFKAYLASR
jgi:hypothetical protein